MRRASYSVPSNIAEGWTRKKRDSILYYLDIANGSLSELETFIIISQELSYIDIETGKPILEEINSISRLIYGMQKYLRSKAFNINAKNVNSSGTDKPATD